MPRQKDPLAPQAPPTPTRSDSSEIVEAIVAATIALGGSDPSMNLIAERAGVGIASVYRYFPSKPAIYAEISRRLQRAFLEQLQALLSREDLELEEAVSECCRIAVEVPGVSPELRKILNLLVPLSWSKESADAVFPAAIDGIVTWLEARMNPPPNDLRARVFVVFAAARGMIMMSRLYPELAPSDPELVRRMSRVSLAYLRE